MPLLNAEPHVQRTIAKNLIGHKGIYVLFKWDEEKWMVLAEGLNDATKFSLMNEIRRLCGFRPYNDFEKFLRIAGVSSASTPEPATASVTKE